MHQWYEKCGLIVFGSNNITCSEKAWYIFAIMYGILVLWGVCDWYFLILISLRIFPVSDKCMVSSQF